MGDTISRRWWIVTEKNINISSPEHIPKEGERKGGRGREEQRDRGRNREGGLREQLYTPGDSCRGLRVLLETRRSAILGAFHSPVMPSVTCPGPSFCLHPPGSSVPSWALLYGEVLSSRKQKPPYLFQMAI